MAYDPQRNRARARPAADEAAPVDLVLGGTIEPERAVLGGTIEPERAVLGGTIEPERAVLDRVREHGPDLRLIAAAGVAAVAAVAFALRRRAARR